MPKKSSIRRKSKSNSPTRRVRFNSPANTTRKYSLNSSERKEKRDSPKGRLRPCGENGPFPCTYSGARFDNIQELNEFFRMRREKNASTNYRNVSAYRLAITSQLHKQGKYKKKIPEEFRIYNTQTGEVFDMRDLNSIK